MFFKGLKVSICSVSDLVLKSFRVSAVSALFCFILYPQELGLSL